MNATRKSFALILVYSIFAAQSAMAFSGENSTLPLPTSGNVTLSLAEYNKLVDLAAKWTKKREQPPVPYTLKHAELKLRVGSESVLGTVLLDGEVFSRNATKVPLTTGMTILNAQQQGKNLPLLQEGSSATAVLPGQSDFSIALDTGLPLAIEVGRASFALPVPAAGSVRLSLAIPGDHTLVRISPGLITSRISEKGQTVVEAALVPGQVANIWWATREIAAPVAPKEVRFLSDVKTLVSVSEGDLKLAALAEATVVQGEPNEFSLSVPANFDITDVTGSTVESSEVDGSTLIIHLSAGNQKSHQFLISMERALSDGKADVPFVSFKNAQRETGEVLVEAAGAMELTAKEGGSLKRMDVKEVNPYLRSLSHSPLQAAFRFHRQPTEAPTLALNWTRFPDSTVLAAVAERAEVTTLVTTEGRSLTEVKLTIKNQAQPFMKVNLPQDATILSADVGGEKVKPVQGTDGNRVPLLRPNFHPTDAYTVSYVFMHSGTPFAKKGGSEISLPSMDVPINILEWEVFLPEQYKVKNFGGDAIAENLLPPVRGDNLQMDRLEAFAQLTPGAASPLPAGSIAGTVVDPSGAVIAGATVKVTNMENGVSRTATSDSSGAWVVTGVPAGTIQVNVMKQGFRTFVARISHDGVNSRRLDSKLNVGMASETVEVTSSAPLIDANNSQLTYTYSANGVGGGIGSGSGAVMGGPVHRDKKEPLAQNQASANVYNLQKRVAGVLPVRVDVPRAGASYRFARALVLDEETKLSFSYKTK
jgi:hypothetical protein